MSTDREGVVKALQPDEIDYPTVARLLGSEPVEPLAELVEDDNVELASKAASLAGFLTTESARDALLRAALHRDPRVRVAAAASVGRHPQLADALIDSLLTDPDPGVRKWTLLSLQSLMISGLRGRIEGLVATEPIPALQELARETAQRLPP